MLNWESKKVQYTESRLLLLSLLLVIKARPTFDVRNALMCFRADAQPSKSHAQSCVDISQWGRINLADGLIMAGVR